MTNPAAAAPPAHGGDWHCSGYTQESLRDVFGTQYYEEGDYSDNSAGCWITDYLWAIGLFCAAQTLSAARRNGRMNILKPPGFEHTRWMLCWGLLSLAISELLAGWYHAVFTNAKAHKHDIVWTLCIVALSFHASFYIMACVAMHRNVDNTWTNYFLYTVAASGGGIFFGTVFAFEMDFPLAFSLGSLIPLTAVCFGIALHAVKYQAWRDSRSVLVGCLLNFLALTVQFANSNTCARPCPEDCMLFAPNFNHNAAFHLIALCALVPTVDGLLGVCQELEDPDGMPYFDINERRVKLAPNYKPRNFHDDEARPLLGQTPEERMRQKQKEKEYVPTGLPCESDNWKEGNFCYNPDERGC